MSMSRLCAFTLTVGHLPRGRACGNVCGTGIFCAYGTCLGLNDAGLCANLTEGSLVTYEQTDAAAPVFTGGTIVSGTYVLTAAEGGSCSGAAPTASTMTFNAATPTSGTFTQAQSTTGAPGTIFSQPVSGTHSITLHRDLDPDLRHARHALPGMRSSRDAHEAVTCASCVK